MKRAMILSVVIAAAIAPFARAEGSLSDAELEIVKTNCVSAQIALQHVRESDLLTRINRGHRYDTLLKLMTNFNGRVVQNKLDAPELITIASDYQKKFDMFRGEYTAYDDGLSAILRMDCREEPTAFIDQLIALQTDRSSLSERVKEFEGLLDKYQKGVNDLKGKQETNR